MLRVQDRGRRFQQASLFRQEAMPWMLSIFYFLTFGGFVAMGHLPAEAAGGPLRVHADRRGTQGRWFRSAGSADASGGWLARRSHRRLLYVHDQLCQTVVVSPDFSDHTKFADHWLPVQPGTDGALAMAMGHLILREFYVDRQVPYFQEYAKKYTDLPMLVTLREREGAYVSDRFLHASDLG